MVGIGAGIPGLPKHDIRLGDLVVSIPRDGHPGVIQYDFVKYEHDKIILKGCLNKSPAILIMAVIIASTTVLYKINYFNSHTTGTCTPKGHKIVRKPGPFPRTLTLLNLPRPARSSL
jgi:hypothetical protein